MLSSPPFRASILSLPSHLRVTAYQQARSFSASPPRRLTLVDIAVAGPSALINGLHAGLPWYAALPTAGILVRGVLGYYYSTLPSRRAAQVQANLLPLASARSLLHLNTVEARARQQKLSGNLRTLDRMVTGVWRKTVELHTLGKQFGAPKFNGRKILNFGMLIAFTEAIRMKCSSKEGLLPLILSPFEAVARRQYPDQFPTPLPQPQPSGPSEEQLRAATTVGEDGVTSIDMSKLRVESAQVHNANFDPTLQEEGLSWCMDLTMPDPTLFLPAALALTTAANIVFRPTAGARKPATPATTSPKLDLANLSPEALQTLQAPPPQNHLQRLIPPITNLQRIGLCITILLFFAAMKMPAAILLYWVPSLIAASLQRRWLDRKIPVLPSIQPCRRPLRYKVRKEWND